MTRIERGVAKARVWSLAAHGPVRLAVEDVHGIPCGVVLVHGTRAGSFDWSGGRDCWAAKLDPDTEKLGVREREVDAPSAPVLAERLAAVVEAAGPPETET